MSIKKIMTPFRIKATSILFVLFITILFTGCTQRDPDSSHTQIRSIVHDGLTRSYRIHVPTNTNEYNALLLVLHGGGGTAKHTEEELTKKGFNTLSDKYKFVVVYPEGIEKRWNDGRIENKPVTHIDDVGFLTKIIDTVTQEFNIDSNRVFVTGISNGGQMSYRLACERTEKIAAIAPVVSSLHEDLYNTCTPSQPISVFIIAGTEDPLVPYSGGDITLLKKKYGTVVSMNEAVTFWATHNNCSPTPIISVLPDINPDDGCIVTSKEYTHGDSNTKVLFYSIEGGGHTWPSGGKYLTEALVGRICYDFNACKHIWNFFNSL
jgi:polyhydroxybutyrate depolymerase